MKSKSVPTASTQLPADSGRRRQRSPGKHAGPPPPEAPRVTRPSLGERVRQIRRESGWTLGEVSRITGVGTSTLSKLENGLVDVSFETVMKICDGLDLSLDHLANHQQAAFRPGVRTVTRRDSGLRLITPAYGFEVLCTDVARKGLLPVLVTVKARSLAAVERKSQHPGEEFIHVLRGRIELHTEFYAPTVLEEGDSAYYDSSGPHAFVNAGDAEAIVLSVSRDSSGKDSGATGHLQLEG